MTRDGGNTGGPSLPDMAYVDPMTDIQVYDTLGPLTRRAIDECRFRASAAHLAAAVKLRGWDFTKDDARIAAAIRAEDAAKPGWAD